MSRVSQSGVSHTDWQEAYDELYCWTVVPRRSVDRIRRALAEGRDPEAYLEDIEGCLNAAAEHAKRLNDRPPACPHCLGTGHVLEDA